MGSAFLAAFGACAALCVLAAVYVARSMPRQLLRRYSNLNQECSQTNEELRKELSDIRHEFKVWEDRMDEIFDATERKRRRMAGRQSRENGKDQHAGGTRDEQLADIRRRSGLA